MRQLMTRYLIGTPPIGDVRLLLSAGYLEPCRNGYRVTDEGWRAVK
jgi:hypothetical protein